MVFGATRGTGFLTAKLLVERGYRVRALARDPVRARERLPTEVEVVRGDITRQETLRAPFESVEQAIFTAGLRTGRPATERRVRATDYQGVVYTLAGARHAGFRGRLLYMNTIGVTRSSLFGTALNLFKRNVMKWRRRAEDEIRSSGIDYTIVRVGHLNNRPAGQHAIVVSQQDLPLALKYRIARADVAEALVEAMSHPATRRVTFDLVWGMGTGQKPWDELFRKLKPDP